MDRHSPSEITDILLLAHEKRQSFYTIEISSRGPSRRKLKQAIREAENTYAFLMSQGAPNPQVNSWLICRSRSITHRNQKWINQLNQIYASTLKNEFVELTRQKILKLESYLHFTVVDRYHLQKSQLNNTHFKQINMNTQGKFLEEYHSQVLHKVFSEAVILPRVAYNGNAETLKFKLENEEERKTSEVDILMIADKDYIHHRLALLEEDNIGFTNLKDKIK